MIVLTHSIAVSGYVQRFTIFDEPSLALCSIATISRLAPDGNIHRSTDISSTLCARHPPIRKVALLGNLHPTEDTHIEMAAARHYVRDILREKRRSRNQSDWHFHRVDQIEIFFARFCTRSHAQHAVLTVEVDRYACSDVRCD